MPEGERGADGGVRGAAVEESNGGGAAMGGGAGEGEGGEGAGEWVCCV